ncbi:hypothetical protein [Nesterenkonia sp.]|uniref:hypothetical protein n=1 Tax=Nesterenkonia sp. TaxID=704201 RepID=UPI002623ADBC|nr:hypothetical protein [Nesterenkonia sp.]
MVPLDVWIVIFALFGVASVALFLYGLAAPLVHKGYLILRGRYRYSRKMERRAAYRAGYIDGQRRNWNGHGDEPRIIPTSELIPKKGEAHDG